MLSPEDLAYQESCRQYAATELVEIEEKYGEINEVPEELRRRIYEGTTEIQKLIISRFLLKNQTS